MVFELGARRSRARGPRAAALGLLAAMAASGCARSGHDGERILPASDLDAAAGDAAVALTWSEVEGAQTYDLFWSQGLEVTPESGQRVAGVASPFLHAGLQNGSPYAYVLVARSGAAQSAPSPVARATPSPAPASSYDPPWSTVLPVRTRVHTRDPARSDEENGDLLAAAIAALAPGEELVVGGGTYSFVQPLVVQLAGNAAGPIRVVAKDGETPVLTRPDASAAVVSIGGTGTQPRSEYLALQGFEVTGGGIGIDLLKCRNVWIDSCHVHDTGGGGISATAENTAWLYLTRNDVHHTNSWGEGIQLGKNSTGRITHHSVIALNHIHDTAQAVQGDGIDMKRGSYANWIAENRVHGTRYPCIFFEGNGGLEPNLIERNVCWDSMDNVMQAEGGDAIVRNNLLATPAGNKLFDSSHNAATLQNLTVVHNTMVGSNGYGAGLFAWNGQPGLVFANNVVYVKTYNSNNYALYVPPGAGATFAGNVLFGAVRNVPSGWVAGNGLGDFAGVPGWGWTPLNGSDAVVPSATGALIASGDLLYAEEIDLTGTQRVLPLEAGCRDRP